MYRPPCFAPSYPWYGYNRPGYNYNNRPNKPNVNSPGSGNINWGGGNQINVGGDVNININNNSGNNNLYAKNEKLGNKGVSSGIKNADMSNMNIGKPGTKSNPAVNNARPGQQSGRPTPSNQQGVPDKSKLPNDVFADKDGNVYKKDNKGEWQQNNGKDWAKPAGDPNKGNVNPNARPAVPNQPAVRPATTEPKPSAPQARPATPSGYSRPSTPGYSDYDRNRGTQKANSYPSAKPAAPAARPAPSTPAKPIPKGKTGF
jgi:hypothetical protein